jgi:hypothetical protein
MAAMFILYAVVAGVVVGRLSGGSPARLGDLRFEWAPLIALGMGAQVVLFTTPVGDALGPAAPILYVASNVAVLAAVARNLAIPGLALVLAGGASNLIAICANGGYMPANPGALAALGRSLPEGYTNSRVGGAGEHVPLWPLTDLFAMPAWLPAANIFSVGDLLIGIGAAVAVVAAMHGRGPHRPRQPAAAQDGTGLTGAPNGASRH